MTTPTTPTDIAGASDDRPVIIAEHLHKKYDLRTHIPSLRHELSHMVTGIFQRRSEVAKSQPFWAIEDINFAIYPGESVAIIGRNGAGKSTLFRLLSGVTSPTSGTLDVRGRFATLIALGSGFNPELSGRQNIFLNAAIQGVPQDYVRSVVDEIIEFAELVEFIDTPVKRYSSGMSARLGFSVAIHTAPKIIFIDEVLSVGDAAFQEKCIQRIKAMNGQGYTLLMVSHLHTMVRSLCTRALWLDKGHLVMDGPIEEVLQRYESMTLASHES